MNYETAERFRYKKNAMRQSRYAALQSTQIATRGSVDNRNIPGEQIARTNFLANQKGTKRDLKQALEDAISRSREMQSR